MIWPWVSRGWAEALQKALDREIERNDRLMDRLSGLVDKAGQNVQVAPEPRLPDVVTQAVIAKSRGIPTLYQHYGAFVAARRAIGATEESIAQEILHGVEDDQGLP